MSGSYSFLCYPLKDSCALCDMPKNALSLAKDAGLKVTVVIHLILDRYYTIPFKSFFSFEKDLRHINPTIAG